MLLLQPAPEHSGSKPHSVRKFPFLIGRGPASDLRLDLPGVWEGHASIRLDRTRDKFVIAPEGDALLLVNGSRVEGAHPLAVGDLLSLGAGTFTVGLAPVAQRELGSREMAVWLLAGAVVAGQFLVASWLL